MRACIAALLNLKLEEVPDFMGRDDAMADHPTGYPVWYLAMQQWLAGKGYTFLEVQLQTKNWLPLPYETFAIFLGERETAVRLPCEKCNGTGFNPWGDNPIACEHCEGGTIEASASCRHAIVGKCEGETFYPIFDPLGVNPLTSFKDNRILGLAFLVPIDPALILEMGRAMEKTIRLARQLPFSEIKDAILANAEEVFGLAQIELPMRKDPNSSTIITPDDNRTTGGLIVP